MTKTPKMTKVDKTKRRQEQALQQDALLTVISDLNARLGAFDTRLAVNISNMNGLGTGIISLDGKLVEMGQRAIALADALGHYMQTLHHPNSIGAQMGILAWDASHARRIFRDYANGETLPEDDARTIHRLLRCVADDFDKNRDDVEVVNPGVEDKTINMDNDPLTLLGIDNADAVRANVYANMVSFVSPKYLKTTQRAAIMRILSKIGDEYDARITRSAKPDDDGESTEL